jgi:Filamin/ABP280 repeat
VKGHSSQYVPLLIHSDSSTMRLLDTSGMALRSVNQDAHFGAQMEDLGTGEYAGAFSAMAAGAYSVSVTFQGTHIAGSPFAAEASLRQCHANTAAGCVRQLMQTTVSWQPVFIVHPAMPTFVSSTNRHQQSTCPQSQVTTEATCQPHALTGVCSGGRRPCQHSRR